MSNTKATGYRRKDFNPLAYDELGPRVRRALQEAVIGWDADWCLRKVREHGADWVIKAIRDGDIKEASRTYQIRRFEKGMQSSFKDRACRVSILRANW
jgi:hypothetical protein